MRSIPLIIGSLLPAAESRRLECIFTSGLLATRNTSHFYACLAVRVKSLLCLEATIARRASMRSNLLINGGHERMPKKYVTKVLQLSLADYLIASQTIEHNMKLVTKDRDFLIIEELDVLLIQ
ncbi:MAG: hypothetical protein ABIH34_06405 [Nanoarchaeota archaeon]